jgi:diguanylate cyclase (GGDEF)-like protein/PAS domain S-box-containing protein
VFQGVIEQTSLVAHAGWLAWVPRFAAIPADLLLVVPYAAIPFLIWLPLRQRRELAHARDERERCMSEHSKVLLAAKTRFETLILASAEILWTANAAGEAVEDSQSWRAFTGQTVEEHLGAGWLDAIHPDDHDRVKKAWEEAVGTQGIFSIEYRLHHVTGDWRWMAAKAVPPLTGTGRAQEWIVTNTDITERRLAERDRQTQIDFFESLDRVNRAIQGANSLDQMMSDILDVALTIFECDRASLLYPLDPEAAEWHVPMERTRPEYPGAHAAGVTIPNNPIMTRDFRCLLEADGPLKSGPGGDFSLPPDVFERLGFRSVISVAIYPKVGKPWLFALLQCSYARVWTPEDEQLFQEVGRRVADGLSSLLSHRNLCESEQKYREIFNNMSDALALFDITENGRFRFADVNPCAEKLTGIPRSAVAGQFFEDVAQPHVIEHLLPLFRQCVETGKPHFHEAQVELRTGRPDLDTILLPVRNDAGSVYRLLLFARNVTDIRTAERQLRTLVESLPDCVARFDRDARHVYVNPAITAMSGIAFEAYIGKTNSEADPIFGQEQQQEVTQSVRRVFDTGHPSAFDLHFPMLEGQQIWEVRHIPELDQEGKVTSVLSISRDITERIRMTDSLRQLSAAVEQSPVSVLITDINGAIEYVNPEFCANSGYMAPEVLGKNPRILRDNAMSQEEYAVLWDTIKAGNAWHGTFHNQRKDGTRHWDEAIIAPIRDVSGAITQFVGIQQDITARKKAEERVEFLANHDALTGLPNRLLGKDRMERAMEYANHFQCKTALLFLDLDGFKCINDSLGHGVGDELLNAVAARLQLCVRKSDTIARQGGDEFLVSLANVHDAEAVTTVALSVREHMRRPFLIQGHELAVSVSIGIAVYPDDGRDWDTLFKKADLAMYSAKEAGRNTYRFFTQQMNADADEYLRLRNSLQHALDRQEFVLHYQPQINLRTGQVSGVEALIRWNSPELGLVLPGRFIPLAEDSGLIIPIGEWVLKEACRQAAAWRQAGMPRLLMAVNLSAVQFKRGDMLSSVKDALAKSTLDPACLELEMTESILIKDTAAVLATVQQLKAMGIKLSIDDFGTGYSSLSYLTRFNADKVKIDQSFVRNIVTDTNSDVIVSTIVHMAQRLGLTTIAEGVEDEGMLKTLRHHDCDEVQGYYYARPMPAEQVSVFLKNRSEDCGAH